MVSDRIGPPTYATDLANAILDIMQNVAFKEAEHQIQVYHYSNEVEISWYEFGKKFFELTREVCKVSTVATAHFPTPAKRP